jgi:hypothetical protein
MKDINGFLTEFFKKLYKIIKRLFIINYTFYTPESYVGNRKKNFYFFKLIMNFIKIFDKFQEIII